MYLVIYLPCYQNHEPSQQDSSKSPAMFKSALCVIPKAIQFLNPGQSPAVTFYQPLHALAKRIQ